MRQRSLVATALVLLTVLFSAGAAGADPGGPNTPASGPLGTAFTYQGRLNNGSTPFDGSCDIAFRLYDDPLAGVLVGGPITPTVAVASGYFTALLDFGSNVFTGPARWLDIRVKCGADPAFIPLSPRQPLTAAPYALALPGLYTQQNITSTNLIGGYSGNLVTGAAAYGVIIAGGGSAASPNTVQGGNVTYSTISGGVGNVISGTNVYHSVIGGGRFNAISGLLADDSTIAGGDGNSITGPGAFIGGGGTDGFLVAGNQALGAASTVGGGISNTVVSYGDTVAGGQGNTASNNHSTVSGGFFNLANGWNATVAGGTFNHAGGAGSAIGGGGWDGSYQLGNQALGPATIIGGGLGNVISPTALYSVIGGGSANLISNTQSFIGGGTSNLAGGQVSVVGGGLYNHALGAGATIGGGGWDGNSYAGNQALGGADTIGGGLGNVISPTAFWSTNAGGYGNLITGNTSYIGGGWFNVAGGGSATVGGGSVNHAFAAGATIGGGGWDGTTNLGNTASGPASTIAGGISNTVGAYAAVIGGGYNNLANGSYATVPGGIGNTAHGAYSFAAGHGANAKNDGAFVWSCSSCPDTSSAGANEFVINALGGIYIGDGTTSGPPAAFNAVISTSVGAKLTTAGIWTDVSDRNVKTDFADVDPRQVLATLVRLPVQTWRYKVEDAGTRHIGPMAQDFFAAFSVGNDNTHLAALDTNGVALAAVQGLNLVVQDQQAQITALQSQAAAQQQVNADLQARLSTLESRPAVPASPTLSAASQLPPLGWLLFGGLLLLNLGGLLGYFVARATRARAAGGAA